MSGNSTIEWTDATWNPVTGCTKISPGCDNCCAATFAERFRGTPGHYFARGFDMQVRADKVNLPLTWRKPKRVFVNSMSDLFHTDIDQAWIADVFAVMTAAGRHTFQVLTKRHARMRTLLSDAQWVDQVRSRAVGKGLSADAWRWPLPNVWLGVSVENQQWADIRIPALLDTPAAVRFLSCEPLLGPVDLSQYLGVDWVIAGGESGAGARPMHPDWARSIRDQCQAAGVRYFFKQYGAWVPESAWLHRDSAPAAFLDVDGRFRPLVDGKPAAAPMARGEAITIRRVGKKAGGRELDGRTWDQFPDVTTKAVNR